MSCSALDIEQMDDRTLDAAILKAIRWDDGAAAESHLQAGRPIAYSMPPFEGEIVREWPDGTKELITVSDEGVVTVVGCVISR